MKIVSIDSNGKRTIFSLNKGELSVKRLDTDGSRLSRKLYKSLRADFTIGKLIAARQELRAAAANKFVRMKPEYECKPVIKDWDVNDVDITKAYPTTHNPKEYRQFIQCEEATRLAWEENIAAPLTINSKDLASTLYLNELFEDVRTGGFYKNCTRIEKEIDVQLRAE